MQNAPVWCLVIIPYAIDYKDGERGRNRTFNLLIKSQLLCQLSYAPEGGLHAESKLVRLHRAVWHWPDRASLFFPLWQRSVSFPVLDLTRVPTSRHTRPCSGHKPLCVGLLLGQVSHDGQLEHLMLIGLDHQQYP